MLAEAPFDTQGDRPENLDRQKVLEKYNLARVEVIRLNEVLKDCMLRLAELDGFDKEYAIGRAEMGSETLSDLLKSVYPGK